MKLLHVFNEEGFSDEEICKMRVRRAVRIIWCGYYDIDKKILG